MWMWAEDCDLDRGVAVARDEEDCDSLSDTESISSSESEQSSGDGQWLPAERAMASNCWARDGFLSPTSVAEQIGRSAVEVVVEAERMKSFPKTTQFNNTTTKMETSQEDLQQEIADAHAKSMKEEADFLDTDVSYPAKRQKLALIDPDACNRIASRVYREEQFGSSPNPVPAAVQLELVDAMFEFLRPIVQDLVHISSQRQQLYSTGYKQQAFTIRKSDVDHVLKQPEPS